MADCLKEMRFASVPPEPAYGPFPGADLGQDLSGTLQGAGLVPHRAEGSGAGGVGGLLIVSLNGTNCFPAFDGNGNVMSLVTASDGTLVAEYEYGPFGEVLRATGPMAAANPFRFSTKCEDESGLLYYGYRYYDPETGRWLSRDPIEEDGGSSLYSFVVNDPLGQFDYIGLKWAIEKRSSESRFAIAVGDCGDTVRELAGELRLDPDEFTKWLTNNSMSDDPLPRSADDKLSNPRKFRVPNMVHITAGWTKRYGDWLGATQIMQNYESYYKTQGYMVLVHFGERIYGVRLDQINGYLSGSSRIYKWVHVGHGRPRTFGGKVWVTVGPENVKMKGPDAFKPHHKLSEVVIHACFSYHGPWLSLVAPGGSFWGAEGTTNPDDLSAFGSLSKHP